MSSASSSIEMPAFTRRTFDWDRTSLLKGMSREALRVIFWTAVAMSNSPRRAAESLSLDLQPITEIPALLSLSSAAEPESRECGTPVFFARPRIGGPDCRAGSWPTSGIEERPDTGHDHRPGVGGLGQPFDCREVGVRTLATNLNIDPMARTASMGAAQAVVRRGVETLIRFGEANTRGEEDDARAEIAAEQELVGRCGLRPAADLLPADLAKRFVKTRWIRRCPCGDRPVELPRRPMRIDEADRDLMQEVEQADGIGRIGTGPPESDDDWAKLIVERSEPGARPPPGVGSLVALLLLLARPPFSPSCHLLVFTRLPGRDEIGEQGELLALEALRARQGGALAGRVLIGRDTGPSTEPHQAASRPASAETAAVAGAVPGRKARIQSAALDAALAARTTARLSSRSTSSQEPI